MDKRKLTLADCFKYPFAEIFSHYHTFTTVVQFMEFYSDQDEAPATEWIKDYKLKLRPFESLTEEEKEKLSELWMDGKPLAKIIGGFISRANLNSTDYLRSINIDIDGLKEQEIAVYE